MFLGILRSNRVFSGYKLYRVNTVAQTAKWIIPEVKATHAEMLSRYSSNLKDVILYAGYFLNVPLIYELSI